MDRGLLRPRDSVDSDEWRGTGIKVVMRDCLIAMRCCRKCNCERQRVKMSCRSLEMM